MRRKRSEEKEGRGKERRSIEGETEGETEGENVLSEGVDKQR